jgi:hypothetical protein
MIEYTWTYRTPNTTDATLLNNWDTEVFRSLYTVCLKALNDMAISSEWDSTIPVKLEADSATVCALESLDQFKLSPDGNPSMCYKVGTIGPLFEVWRNQLAGNNYILLITNNGKVARINIEGLANSGVK